MSDCYVSAKDYRRHWDGEAIVEFVAPVWSGTERRVALTDRRVTLDRRWDRSRGQRYRIFDRRRAR